MSSSAPSWKTELAALIAPARRVVVLGIGNPDRGDDGAGVLVAEKLAAVKRKAEAAPGKRRRPAIKVVAGGVAPESTTGEVRAFAPDLAILVDAASGNNPPGTIAIIPAAEIAEEEMTTHRLPLTFLVRYIEETIGCRVVVVGLQPGDSSIGTPISRPVAKAAAAVTEFLSRTLFSRK